ncbi:hypothetical protein BY458DRAFT_552541 [Sporodiniella umbellata]|nr:hypothetical protein BY458DRAFT_552541 [Sporodiniella umbellata]
MKESHSVYHESKTLEENVGFPWEDDAFSLALEDFCVNKPTKYVPSSPLQHEWYPYKALSETVVREIPMSPATVFSQMESKCRSPSVLSRQTAKSSYSSSESWKLAHTNHSLSTACSLPTFHSLQTPLNPDDRFLYEDSQYSYQPYFDPAYKPKKKVSVWNRWIQNLKNMFAVKQ